VKIVRFNPFPPYPPRPRSISEGEWVTALLHYRPLVEWRIKELRSDLLAAKVPPSKVPSVGDLVGRDAGFVDALSAAMAQTRVAGDKLWESVSPEAYVSTLLSSTFDGASGNKRAEKRLAAEVVFLASRIRDDLLGVGRVPVEARPPSERPASTRPASTRPASTRPASARPASEPPPSARPASEKPAKKPRTRKKPAKAEEPPPSARPPSARPPSARPPSARPPSASSRPPSVRRTPPSASSRVPSEEEMEESMVEAAEAILPSLPPPPSEEYPGFEDVPPFPEDDYEPSEEEAGRRTRPSGRPPSMSSGQIPRIRSLSEATLRAEREWFYENKEASRMNRPCPMTRRLEGFWPYRAGMRPPVRPPKDVLEKYEDDILLMVVPPNNVVQVFAKGALTEVFASSREENALSIAARYANQWRGVKRDGTVTRDAKRSRLNASIWAAYYIPNDKNVLADISEVVRLGGPITEVLERDMGARGRKLANPARGRSTPRRLMMRDEVDAPYAPTIIRIRNPR
jgi:hypothetical protein